MQRQGTYAELPTIDELLLTSDNNSKPTLIPQNTEEPTNNH